MNKLGLAVFFLFFLILVPNLVLADYMVESIDFNVGSNPVTHVLPLHTQIVDIVVNISTNETIDSLIADLTDVNPNPTKFLTYQNKEFTCFIEKIEDVEESIEQLGESEKEELMEEEPVVIDDKNYICHANKIVYIPQSTNVSINFTISSGATKTNLVENKTFQLDETKPKLKSFKTEFCEGDKCFIAKNIPTKLFIQLEDSTATFYQEKIFFEIENSASQRVTSCEGNSCEGLYTEINCQSMDRVHAKLITAQGIPSSDDAGNPVEGELTRTFVCDEYAPGEQNINGESVGVKFNVTHTGAIYYNRPKSGDTLTITSTISEDVSGVGASANFSEIGGSFQSVSCNLNSGAQDYTCKFVITNIKGGDYSIPINFTDGVGRETTKILDLQIDELVQPEEGDGVPKFFKDITAVSPAKNGYNRVALSLAQESKIQYPVFVTFKPQKDPSVPGSVELLFTNIDDLDKYSCKMYSDGVLLDASTVSTINFGISDPLAKIDEQNKVNFNLLVDANDINDSLEIVCNVSALVRVDGNKVYSTPTKFLLRMPLKFRNSRLSDEAPGKRYADRIKKVQDSTRTFNKLVGVMNSIYATLQDICSAKRTMNGIGMSLGNIQLAGGLLSKSGVGDAIPAVGNAGEHIAEATSKAGKSARKIGGANTDAGRSGFSKNLPTSLNIQEILTQSCQLVTCSVDAQNDKTGFSIKGGVNATNFFKVNDEDGSFKKFSNGMAGDVVEDIFSDISIPDVKGSLISAVTARCLPAIVYHLNEYRQMNCHTITCMKTQAAYGTDISVCDQAKAQFICEKVIGEVFDLGGIRQVKNVVDNTNAYIQNIIPNTLKSLTQNSFCKGYSTLTDEYIGKSIEDVDVSATDIAKITLCTIPEALANQMNFLKQTTKSKKTFTYTVKEDACELAYCDSIHPEDCDVKGSSYIKKLLGFDMPTSTLDMLQMGVEENNNDYKYVLDQREISKLSSEQLNVLNSNREKDLNEIMNSITGEDSVTKDSAKKTTNEDVSNLETLISKKKELQTECTALEQKQSTVKNKLKNLNENIDQGERYLEIYKSRLNEAMKEFNKLTPSEISSTYTNTLYTLNSEIFLKTTELRTLKSEKNDLINKQTNLNSEKDSVSKNLKVIEGKISSSKKSATDEKKSKKESTKDSEDKTKDDTVDEKTSKNDKESTKEEQVDEAKNAVLQESAEKYVKEQEDYLKTLETYIVSENKLYETCKSKNDQICMGEHYDNIKNADVHAKNLRIDIAHFKNEDGTYNFNALIARKRSQLEAKKKAIYSLVDTGISYALQNGYLNWASLTSFGHDSALGKVSDWSDTWLNMDNYKDKICSANFILPKDKESQKGSVIQCKDNFCVPVLTEAVEKTRLNNSHWIYTATYSIGNIRAPDMFTGDEVINFNVFFKNKNVLSNKLFNSTWLIVPYGNVAGDTFAFISNNNFDEMCVIFENAFPPDEIGKKKEYCRPIVDASINGDSDFDTGSPVGADYLSKATNLVKTNPGNVPMNTI